MNNKLVTIITAVYNGKQFLEYAIKSVKMQTYSNIQYIIIDGGSTDGTQEIIKKHTDFIDVWISEKDEGIADAWNKGLKLAKGEIIGFLNADDYYANDSISKVVEAIDTNQNCVTYGETVWIDRETGKELTRHNYKFNPETIYNGFAFCHTSCFVTKGIYDKLGGFDIKYKIAIDTDFLLRCLKNGINFKHIDNATYMRNGGLSEKQEKLAMSEFYFQLIHYGYSRKNIFLALFRRYKRHPITMLEVLLRFLFSEKA